MHDGSQALQYPLRPAPSKAPGPPCPLGTDYAGPRTMVTHPDRRPVALNSRLSSTRAIESILDPLMIVVVLMLAGRFSGAHFDQRYVLVAFIAFSANFPGRSFLTDPRHQLVRDTFVGWAIFASMLLLFGYVTQYIRYFPAQAIVLWLVFTPIAQIAAHPAARQILSTLFTLEGRLRVAVIVGCNAAGLRLADSINNQPLSGVKCVGFFDDRSGARVREIYPEPLLGNLEQLPQYVRDTHVDNIYLSLPMARQPRIVKILDDLKDTTASIFFVPDIFFTDLIQGRVDDVAGVPIFAVCDTPFFGITGAVKRALDIFLSSLLLLLLSPVLLTSGLAVKLSSPGPVVFKQRRYGLDGREILVYKFRTMTVTEDGDSAYSQVIRDDPRVTRVGARLRQFSLDELPQLLNVLLGQMSIVGPRPHAVAVNEQYRRLIPGYMVRHKVKPGITGWAQVHGYRGGDDLESMTKRIECDLEYLRRWSVGLDLLIILRTVRVLLGRDDRAY